MKIYFAGKVPKGREAIDYIDWRELIGSQLQRAHSAVEILSPENAALDENDSLSVFGHDCHLIQLADLIVVNASQKLGVGTAQEMLIAKYFHKPVLTILPPDTHHRRSQLEMNGLIIPDWKHPFIVTTSDEIFDCVDALGRFLAEGGLDVARARAKSISIVDDAIAHYLRQYPRST